MAIKINGNIYEATVAGRIADAAWDGRQSKTITLTMEYAVAAELFVDGVTWSIVDGDQAVEYDNSDYSLAGDITDHRDGTISVKMGKLTDLEEILEIIYGGEE